MRRSFHQAIQREIERQDVDPIFAQKTTKRIKTS